MSAVVSIENIKKLRDMTGAGMGDCKQALTESAGDIEGAIEYLRKKGQKLAVKRADREAKEGVVIARLNADATRAIVVKVSCETDFVSKNEDFVSFVTNIADLAIANFPATKDDLLAIDLNGAAISGHISEKLATIGEKIELTDYEKLEGAQLSSYIHSGNRAGVILAFNKSGIAEVAGKDVAMQIAAMKPVAVNKDGVSADTIAKEIEIGKEQARAEGKSEEMLEKIALGKLNKFYQENTLLAQAFVKDNKLNVQDYLKTFDKELTVTAFYHVALG